MVCVELRSKLWVVHARCHEDDVTIDDATPPFHVKFTVWRFTAIVVRPEVDSCVSVADGRIGVVMATRNSSWVWRSSVDVHSSAITKKTYRHTA